MKLFKIILLLFIFATMAHTVVAKDNEQIGALNEKMQQALNQQINAELHASYLYLSMAAYLESNSLVGAASWMRHQAEEESEHAMKFFDYIHDRDGKVTLTDIKAPANQWESPLAVFQDAYKHEQKVTQMINNLVKLANESGDAATLNFLQFFLEEQVEELASAKLIVDRLKMVGNSSPGLLMLDQQLGERDDSED